MTDFLANLLNLSYSANPTRLGLSQDATGDGPKAGLPPTFESGPRDDLLATMLREEDPCEEQHEQEVIHTVNAEERPGEKVA